MISLARQTPGHAVSISAGCWPHSPPARHSEHFCARDAPPRQRRQGCFHENLHVSESDDVRTSLDAAVVASTRIISRGRRSFHSCRRSTAARAAVNVLPAAVEDHGRQPVAKLEKLAIADLSRRAPQ